MKIRPYKLIFLTLIGAIVFTLSSLSAYALFDPITGAAAGAGAAGGFGIIGFGGTGAASASDILNPGTNDPYSWSDLDKYGVVHHKDANTVEITLSPDIARAGNRRLESMNSVFGLAPGTLHQFGTFYVFGDYVFNRSTANNWKCGPIISVVNTDSLPWTISLNGGIATDVLINESGTRGVWTATVGSYSNTSSSSNYRTWNGSKIDFRYKTDTGAFAFGNYGTTSLAGGAVTGTSGLVTQNTYSIDRSNDSEIIDPEGGENVITLPKTYVDNISYTPDQTITNEDIIIQLLQAILSAWENDDIEESVYTSSPVPPGPTPTPPPVPTDPVSDVPFNTFTDWFDNYFSGWTEVFGDIKGEIEDLHESFGDWVDDVASGWTEVFGDIADAVSSGFDTVADTLSDIVDGIADIAESIVNGDTTLISGFLDHMFNAFKSWFDTIKSHLSIWHYVVEWLQSINGVFTFFFTTLSTVNYNFVLPIYAAFAGTVVIAIYRRFGK